MNLYVKDFNISDGVLRDGYAKLFFTLVTDSGEHELSEWLDRSYKTCRDRGSLLLAPGYTPIKQILKGTTMSVNRLMSVLDHAITLERAGKKLCQSTWATMFKHSRKS